MAQMPPFVTRQLDAIREYKQLEISCSGFSTGSLRSKQCDRFYLQLPYCSSKLEGEFALVPISVCVVSDFVPPPPPPPLMTTVYCKFNASQPHMPPDFILTNKAAASHLLTFSDLQTLHDWRIDDPRMLLRSLLELRYVFQLKQTQLLLECPDPIKFHFESLAREVLVIRFHTLFFFFLSSSAFNFNQSHFFFSHFFLSAYLLCTGRGLLSALNLSFQ